MDHGCQASQGVAAVGIFVARLAATSAVGACTLSYLPIDPDADVGEEFVFCSVRAVFGLGPESGSSDFLLTPTIVFVVVWILGLLLDCALFNEGRFEGCGALLDVEACPPIDDRMELNVCIMSSVSCKHCWCVDVPYRHLEDLTAL